MRSPLHQFIVACNPYMNHHHGVRLFWFRVRMPAWWLAAETYWFQVVTNEYDPFFYP